MDNLKCPCCGGAVVEVSSIAPALVKCQGECGANFEASFVRGYWFNRPEKLSADETILMVIALDFCSTWSHFEYFERVGFKAVSEKLVNSVPPETFQYAEQRLKAVYG